MITAKDVRYVADLANLELSEAECASLQKELSAILDYIGHLSELDTSNMEPMAQVAQIAALRRSAGENLRPDELRESLPRQAAMSNAPVTDGTFFRVPKVIER